VKLGYKETLVQIARGESTMVMEEVVETQSSIENKNLHLVIFQEHSKSINHIFVQCHFTHEVWSSAKSLGNCPL
jgi:hypothetical protein